MKFINFDSNKKIEQLTVEQLRGLVKLENGKEEQFRDCDELSVVLLAYDTGLRAETIVITGEKIPKVFEHEKNSLILVVGKCKVHSKAIDKSTQVAIYDKHMNLVISFAFNSDFSVEDVLKNTSPFVFDMQNKLIAPHLTRERAERDFIMHGLQSISYDSKLWHDICEDKLKELIAEHNAGLTD